MMNLFASHRVFRNWNAKGLFTFGAALTLWISACDRPAPPLTNSQPQISSESDWTGKDVFVRKLGLTISDSATGDNRKKIAELKTVAYRVIADENGQLKVRDRGHEGWFDKTHAVLWDDAIDYFAARIRASGNDALAFACRAMLRQLKNEDAHAVDDYNEAINLEPKTALWWQLRASYWSFVPNLARAIEDLSEAIRLDGSDAYLLWKRGDYRSMLKEYDSALADYSEAIRLEPKNVQRYITRASIWARKKEFDKAIADLTEGIRLDPENATCFRERARMWVNKNETEKAVSDFDEAIRLDPMDASIYSARAALWSDSEKSFQDHSKAIRLGSADPWDFVCRGDGWLRKRIYRQAIKDYEDAVRMAPAIADSNRKLAWVLATCPRASLRDGARALELATKACQQTEWKDALAIETLAACFAEVGQFGDAVQHHLKAMQLAGNQLPVDRQHPVYRRLELYRQGKPYRESD